jgi:prenyltransferase beta subunit
MHGMPSTEHLVKLGIGWLVRTQKESGGFSLKPASQEDPEIKAYALTALNGFGEYKEHLEKALNYLEKAQNPDGSYTSSTPIQSNNAAKKNTQTTCFSLGIVGNEIKSILFLAWALSEMK